MKKAFDQTVRDLKREVNKKVLKVPGIEQKILDATSNEPWGPHGTLLADIAQATRNYHEYQIIMHVIWKRLNDTGKNWRHVYKSLTVLEYLVGHGSERVVDEIKEHAYQISTLSDFQYIDSSGKDQGNNVRRKSQILVSLVNDKEKIQETRQKALTNKDKYRSTFSSSGSHRPGSFSSAGGYGDRYDDDRYDGRYGSRDDDRNGYGRERDLGYRDDDRYARGADYNRDGDGFGRDSDEHSGRGSYKSDDNRSSRGGDDYQFGHRNKSFDKDKDHSYEEDDNYSYRNGGVRANDTSPDARNLESKLSEQRASAPPSYESAVRNDNNTVQDDRGGVGTAAVPKASSPQNNYNGEHRTFLSGTHILPTSMDDNSFDEFDPRGLTPTGNFALPAANYALPAAGGGSVIDLFSDSSSLDPVNSLALVLTSPPPPASEAEVASTSSGFGTNFVALPSASAALSQPTEDPFGDSPFKALPQENFLPQGQNSMPAVSASAPSFPSSATSMSPVESITHPESLVYSSSLNFDFGEPLAGLSYTPTIPNDPPYPANSTPATQEFPLAQPSIDFMAPTQAAASTAYGHPFFQSPGLAAFSSPAPQTFGPSNVPSDGMASISQLATLPIPPSAQQPAAQANAPAVPRMSIAARPSGSKQSPDAFETKSSVWADTLNRGLVNLNISGSKTNPLADIGVDFDSINRLERRKEKEKAPSANPLTSTATMGKAMGTGSGIGRSGAAAAGGVAINQSSRPMMGHPGMGMGMVMTPTGGAGSLGMGIGGPMNQPSLGMGMGMGGPMNQSLPQGYPGPSYTPSMMGMGGYGSHQPYGGSNGGSNGGGYR